MGFKVMIEINRPDWKTRNLKSRGRVFYSEFYREFWRKTDGGKHTAVTFVSSFNCEVHRPEWKTRGKTCGKTHSRAMRLRVIMQGRVFYREFLRKLKQNVIFSHGTQAQYLVVSIAC